MEDFKFSGIVQKREVKQQSLTKDFLYRREMDPKCDENNEKGQFPLLKPLF